MSAYPPAAALVGRTITDMKRFTLLALSVMALLLITACRTSNPDGLPTMAPIATVPPTIEPTAGPPTAEPTAAPTDEPAAEPTAAPTAEPTAEPAEPAEPEGPPLPAGVFYDLGEAIITQERFPEDSRFRQMPVRLNGVMAVPESGQGPFPVVVILHGTHPGCPVNEAGVDAWPCGDDEQSNYAGFEYLARELAARGYVALSININAENTFGFGEPVPGERLAQLIDHHLSALAEAAAGGANPFGVDLAGVADARNIVLMGHSRGGEAANWLATEVGLDQDLAYANRGYGPVRGLLLIAPAVALFGSNGTNVPLAVIISGCDGDVVDGDGQLFYEAVRLGGGPAPATTVVLGGANHNNFNTILRGDMIDHAERPDCQPPLEPERQRRFLIDYATDFLATLFDPDPAARLAAAARLGMDVTAPAPAELYGLPARVSALPAAADRQTIFIPAAAEDLNANTLGGSVVAEGITTHFCEAGYSVPATNPGSEPCLRPNIAIPSYPAMAVVSWSEPGGALRFELPAGARDLSRFTTLSLRAAVDPLSPLNAAGATQRLTLRLTDGTGQVAAVTTRPDEPALAFPPGAVTEDGFFGPTYTSLLPLSTLRVPLADFGGIDLADVAEIALIFDQSLSGSLFLGDLELSRPPQVIGATSSLLEMAGAESEAVRGVARFHGASTCTGALIDTPGGPDAPAYLITNGHCAQQWDANAVFIDVPADGWSATFDYFADAAEAQLTVPAVRVAYSTMKGRDVAFVELDTTVGELLAQGITPLPLSSAVPPADFTIRVVGAPVSNVPSDVAFLRQETCRAGRRVDLLEFTWHFDDAIASTCRDIFGGSSGSPVFNGDDPGIMGLMNTTTIGGFTPCALGAPCEIAPEGTIFQADTSYATPVYDLSCFAADGAFDLSAAGCPLDDGRQLLISGYATQGTRNPIPTADGATAPATWQAALAGELPYYRYKIGRAGQVDCAVEEGYGAPIALADATVIDEPLPPEEGSYLLCVVAGESAAVDGTWQPVEWATIARVEVDNTPPRLTPQLSFLRDDQGGLTFQPIFQPPELSHFRVKFGPPEATDCAVDEGYRDFLRVPFRLAADELPARICVIGYDTPGNAGQPLDVVVGNDR